MPSSEQFERFIAAHGEKANRILTVMAKRAKFMEAIKTDIGQELLIDVAASMETLLDKIIMERATTQEKADFRALRMIMNKWTDKIRAYNRDIFMVENNTTKVKE